MARALGELRWSTRGGSVAAGYACVVFVLAGCARMLGVDGEYVIEPQNASGASATGGRGASPAAGDDGGAEPGAGGTLGGGSGGAPNSGAPSGGGASPVATGGVSAAFDAGGIVEAGAGGSPVVPPTFCRAGAYVGTYGGQHRPALAAMAVPVDIAGAVTVHVGPESGGLSEVDVTLSRAQGTSGIAATAFLSLDCFENGGAGPLASGASVTTVLVPWSGRIVGTLTIQVAPDGALSGTFVENESASVLATGSGQWSAAWISP